MKELIRQPGKYKFIFLMLTTALLGAATLSFSHPAQAADDQPLDVLVSTVADLRNYNPSMQILVQQRGALEPSENFHLLNIANLEANIKRDASAKRVLTYSQAYQSFKVYSGADEAYVVATYAYRYSDVQSATAAANEVESQITSLSRTKVSTGLESSSTRTIKVSFVGREGTLVTWIIALRGKTLLLVLVEGKDSVSTQAAADVLAASLPLE